MSRRKLIALIGAGGAAIVLALGAAAVLGAPDTQLPWHVKGTGGGATGSSTSYRVGYTTGQSPIGVGASTSYGVGLGFWYGAAGGGGPPSPVGGIAGLPDIARSPSEAPGTASGSGEVIAWLAASAIVAALALSGAAWWSRRRPKRR